LSAGAAAAPQSSLVVAGGSGTAASAVGCGAARRRRGGEVRVEVLLVRGTRGGGGTCECGERADSLAWESRACVNVTSIFFSANKNTINITGNKEAAKHEQVERNLHPLKQAVVGSF